ncbi:hypothetical protein MC885_015543 [Smutsia gigantea]|nr:hypothetical protein MC885_015543 [Smutsia gigantea]
MFSQARGAAASTWTSPLQAICQKQQGPPCKYTRPPGTFQRPQKSKPKFDKELSVFKDRLYELDISFPPR